MATNDGGIFVGLHTSIMSGFTPILQGLSDYYGGVLTPVLTAFFALFLVYRGYQIIAGQLTQPVEQTIWDAVRFALVLTVIGNVNGWYDAVVSMINGMSDGFSGQEGGFWALLDTAWAKAQAIAEQLNALDDSIWMGGGICGALAELIVWCGVGFMLMCAALTNLAAELTLKLMEATGPIFIACLVFGWFRDMFSNWLKEIVGCLLTVLFSSLSLHVAMNYLTKTLGAATVSAAASNIITLAFQCGLAAVGAGFVVLLSSKIAVSLAGASAQAAAQAMAKSAAGSAASGAGTAAGATGKVLGKIGDKAKNNLQSSPGNALKGEGAASAQSTKAAVKASIARMKTLNAGAA